MSNGFDDYSDEELEQIAYRGKIEDRGAAQPPDFSQMSDEELEAIVGGGVQQPVEAPQGEGYGFHQRRRDEIAATSGRDAYTGQEYVEGLAPFQRGIRESVNREENKNLSAFMDGTALRDAIERHGDTADDALKGYKAQEFGAVETGVREAGHNIAAQAANLPFLVGDAVKGVRGIARRTYNNKATDVLMDYARDAGLSDEDIEKAKETSQGDPYKMYDAFQEMAEMTLQHQAKTKTEAAQKLGEHAEEEGVASKIAGGTLGMIPMMEEFVLGGAAGKALGAGNIFGAKRLAEKAVALEKAANGSTYASRLLAGLAHSAETIPAMGTEMARRRFGELTADEYVQDENGNLVKIEGDTTGHALAKAIPGGFGEAAIFSLPIGEAAMGWAPKVVGKALRTNLGKYGPTVAKMYDNYVKYGQLTGLRGQPVMLGLMDANTFKDEVLGLGKKDAEYEGLSAEWDKFWNETMSLENQADVFVSTLGVMALQGGAALVNARRAIVKERRSTDAVLKTYFDAPDELLRQMAPQQKQMWRSFIVRLGRGDVRKAEDAVGNIRKFADRMGKKFGEENAELHNALVENALKSDNTLDWMQGVDKDAPTQSTFSVPRTVGEDGQQHVAWQKGKRTLQVGNKKVEVDASYFIDPKTGISVTKYLPGDAGLTEEGYIYAIEDLDGRKAFRHGIADAFEAAKNIEHAARNAERVRTEQRSNKRNSIMALYQKYGFKDAPIVYDTLADYNADRRAQGLPAARPGTRAEALENGRAVYILDEIANQPQLQKTVLHEVGRHRGLDLVFDTPEKKMRFISSLAKSGDPVVRDQLNRIIMSRMASGEIARPEEIFAQGKDGQFLHAGALEEVYAHLFDAEGLPTEPSAWQSHINTMRKSLRKIFHGLSVNRAEAEEVYRGAMEKLKAESPASGMDYIPESPEERAERAGIWESPEAAQKRERGRVEQNAINKIFSKEEGSARGEAIAWARKELPDLWKAALDEAGGDAVKAQDGFADKVAEWYVSNERQTERDNALRDELVRRFGEEDDAEARAERRKGDFKAAEEGLAGQIGKGREIAEKRNEAKERERVEHMRQVAKENERRDHQRRLKEAEEADDFAAYRAEVERWEEANRKAEEEEAARREEERWAGARKKAEEDAKAERDAAERARIAQEREEARKAGYESADEKARQSRATGLSDTFQHLGDRSKAENEAIRAEKRRLRAEQSATPIPGTDENAPIISVEPPDTKTKGVAGDVVRTVWRGKNKVNPITIRAVRDNSGKLLGWDILSAEDGKNEHLITSAPFAKHSVSGKRQTAGEALKASENALKRYFGEPFYPIAKRGEGEVSFAELASRVDAETGKARNPAATEVEIAAEEPAPRREIFNGRNRKAAQDILDIANAIDWTGEREGRRTEAEKNGEVADFGDAADAIDWLTSLDPDSKFFDEREELMDEKRTANNRQFINMVGKAWDDGRVRSFRQFAELVKAKNPALYEKSKGRLADIWNYAASVGEEAGRDIPRVKEYEARDAIRSVDSGRNVRDVTGVNALQAALQDIDVEMIPARNIKASDERNPNIKLAADPKSGIIPGKELKGRPRSLLAKPILVIEYADGELHVGTGRHRRELYDRYDMDIPVRRLKETDGWVTKREDGTYDTSKIRLLDALDNIQDSKGSAEDYVSFFEDVKIPREEAEREGFLGSKEARIAYSLANDATEEVRKAANFEGGRREGMITPEQAGTIADAAPKSRWEYNDLVQCEVLKDVLKDRSMDATEIGVDASLVANSIRREIEKGKVFQTDLFGEVIDAGAETREKQRDYIRSQIAKYERLAKDIRSAKNSDYGLTIKREDMRRLGINERNIAKGGADMRREYEAAAQRAMMEAMRWRSGERTFLEPELEDQMLRDLGMEVPNRNAADPEAAYRKWLADTGNPDSPASRKLYEGRVEAADKALDPRQNDLFFNKDEELERKMGSVIDQLVRGGLAKDFPAFANIVRDKNKALFERVAPMLGKLWNDRAKKLGVAPIGEKEYNDVITKLGGKTNGLVSRPAGSGPETGADGGRSGNGVLGNGVQQPGVPGTQGGVGEGTGRSGTSPEGGREGVGVAGTPDGGRRPEVDRGDGKQPSPVAPRGSATDNGADVEEQYTPAKVKIPGAKKSSTPLVESRGLRGIEPPEPKYQHHVPQKLIESGAIQEHQMEGVIYAGHVHNQKIGDGSRKGMVFAHGTGAGKTRIIAGTILDNWEQGRKKALWFSVSRDLKRDVASELSALDMKGVVKDVGDGGNVGKGDGVWFGSYSDLKGEGTVDRIVSHLGKDFDGVIAFDESHTGKTTYGLNPDTGKTEGLVQKAMVDLQARLPNARVVYASATPATEISDLGYATRLGLWGEGTKFKDFADFVKKVKNKKLRGMEAVAQALKRRGQMLSCSLSDKGVEFKEVHTVTTPEQKRAYREMNKATRDIFEGILDAQEAMEDLSYKVPTSSLHGMQQRMHNSMLAAVKLPQIIEKAKEHLAAGESPVFSLFYTNEAGSTREVAKAIGQGGKLEIDEANFGPKQILMDFLTNEKEKERNGVVYKDTQFPTKTVKELRNPITGETESVVVENDRARAIRARLIEEVKALPDVFGNPINMIIEAFGKDNVANLTGLNKDGIEADYEAFKNGDKKVLVFSKKANTGFTFSSDKKFKNQARRAFFKIQNEWRADDFEQAKGRVHRNNQASEPIFYTTTSDFPGEARFFSTIARRKGQLSALSQGDRARGGEMIGERHNLEDDYSAMAIQATIQSIINSGHGDDFARQMNLISRTRDGAVNQLIDKHGNAVKMRPGKFWNRVMLLDPTIQNQVFDIFDKCRKALVQMDIDEGRYDRGLQDSGATRADDLHTLKLADSMSIEHVNNWFKNERVTFDDFTKRHSDDDVRFVRSKRTGEIFAVEPDGTMNRRGMGKVDAVMRYGVDGRKERMYASRVETRNPRSAYEEIKREDAKALWGAEYGTIPEERAEDGFYANGDLLEHWDEVVGSSMPQSYTVKTGKREFIGTKVPLGRVSEILGNYGKGEEAHNIIVDSVVRQILNNKAVELEDLGLRIKGVPRDGGQAVMVSGFADKEAAKKWALDMKMRFLKDKLPEPEATADKRRVFIKADAKTLHNLIDRYPAKLYDEAENPIGNTSRFFNKEEETDERFRDIVSRFGTTGDFDDALLITPKGNLVSSGRGKIEHRMLYAANDRIGKYSNEDLKLAAEKYAKLPNAREIATEDPMVMRHATEILATDIAKKGRMTAEEAVRLAQNDKGVWVSDILDEGGVRIASNGGGLEIGKEPTKEAADKIWDYIDWRERNGMEGYAVDIVDSANDREFTVNYAKHTHPSKVVSDIREYYKTGKIPEGTQNGIRDFRFFNIDEEGGRRIHIKKREDAEDLEAKGVDRRKIWQETGWWKAKDGKWRVEIPGITEAETKAMLDFALASGRFYDKSKDATLNQYAFTLDALERAMKEKGEKLPTSVKSLLAAYPEIGRHRIVVDRQAEQPRDGTLGYASDKEIHLYERGTTAETLNHELQHRIQAAAGMARGTNTSGKSFDRYAHEHGEWEARQASARAKMTPEERAKIAPWETADEHGVAEDATLIDDRNRKMIRPDGEKKPERKVLPATDAKPSLASRYHTNLTDRLHPILEMERADGRTTKEFYREDSPYNAMRLLPGHNEASRMRYEHQWRKPFERMMKDAGVTVDDVGLYMMARDAKDRNRMILERSGKLEGSGMSDEDATKFLGEMKQRLGEKKMAAIEKMADHLWRMQDEGMDRRVESGRVDAKTVEEWRKREPHHVPMRDDLEQDGEVNRSTRQWRKDEFKKAEGRTTMADNPVEFMFKEYQEAVYGSNANDARKVLAKYIQAHPGLGVIKRGVRKGKSWSFTHGQIEDFPDPYYREQSVKNGPGKPNLVAFKDKGNLYMIELDGRLGERVAAAVTGRDVEGGWNWYRKGMRVYASTATEWSPTFIGRNFTADMLESALNTIADKGILKGGYSAIKHVVDALAMTKTIYNYNRFGKFEGKYADVMREYVESGASIGGAGNEGYTELEARFEKVRSGKVGVLDAVKMIGNALSVYNKQAELATRLAVFKDYRDGGASLGEAAMRSREYTTDFNKYGNQRWMNSAWMFSGSVIGSATRQVESIARGKAGRQLALGLVTYGVAEALMEHFFNADEDEKSRKEGVGSGETMTEYSRANSLYFRMGDKFIRVPFHAGPFSALKYAGNVLARVALGDISFEDGSKNLGRELVDTGMHFSGTGDFNSDVVVQSFAPTLMVPFIQAKSNESFMGTPIRKQMFSQTKPYAENGRKATGETWKTIARTLNNATGGNEHRRGMIDVAPEMYKHWFDSIGKNLTRDLSTVADFVTDLAGEETVDFKHIPYGSDYVKSLPDNEQLFYEAEKAYRQDLADNTINSKSPKANTINNYLKQIKNLRHWEIGERKVGQKWQFYKEPSTETREKYKAMRLKIQQRVIELMRK